jgi:hypothetical protein
VVGRPCITVYNTHATEPLKLISLTTDSVHFQPLDFHSGDVPPEVGPARFFPPRHPTHFEPSSLELQALASYDVASNVCRALARGEPGDIFHVSAAQLGQRARHVHAAHLQGRVRSLHLLLLLIVVRCTFTSIARSEPVNVDLPPPRSYTIMVHLNFLGQSADPASRARSSFRPRGSG